MLPIKSVGNRIMILGPSNAGKSTLALAISMKLDIPVMHIDQLQHLPNTDWKIRDEEDFKTCLLYTSPSPRDQRGSRMPSSA